MSMVVQSWDETWMQVARVVAQRSKCIRRQIGAVIVTQENRLISSGYNGKPARFKPNCTTCDQYCPRANRRAFAPATHNYENCVSIHAEANALLFADKRDYGGGTIYVTSACCWDCSKLIGNSGISRVVMEWDRVSDMHRRPQESIDFLQQCDVLVTTV